MRTNQLLDKANITYRQLDHWTRKGWVHAYGGLGSGTSRSYSGAEIDIVVLMADLIRVGISAEKAATIARKMVEKGEWQLTISTSPTAQVSLSYTNANLTAPSAGATH